MHILCLGLSHNTAGVEVRERYAVADGDLAREVTELCSLPRIREAVLVSTCNRVELYVAVDRECVDFSPISDFFRTRGGTGHEEDRGAFYRYLMPESAQHLFRVVSGMDSMVVGETEILGQVKKAYGAAAEAGATGSHLNRLFQTAFRAAKQVRSQTDITRGAVSVGSVAVDLAGRIFGNLKSCRVMIVGAGETGERTARSLRSRGVKSMLVSNRSYERAESLAAELEARAVPYEDWQTEFGSLDILITSTSSPTPILTKEKLAPLMRGRAHRPLFIVDIAVPRDVDPNVNEIEGVYLYDIDSLQTIARQSLEMRRHEVTACEALIAAQIADFEMWMEKRQLDKEQKQELQETDRVPEKLKDGALRSIAD